jgi:hypothetical protein
MDPIPINRLNEIDAEDISLYEPETAIHIAVWQCTHCEEVLGLPYIDDCNVEVCEDRKECPYSVDWNGCACGHVVYSHCHRPASTIYWKHTEGVEWIADEIGVDEEVSLL